MTGRVWIPGPGTAAHAILASADAAGQPASPQDLAPRWPTGPRSTAMHRLTRAGYLRRLGPERYVITPAGRNILPHIAADLTHRAAQVILTLTGQPQRLKALTILLGREYDPMHYQQLVVHLRDLAFRDLVIHDDDGYRLAPKGLALQEAARALLSVPHTTWATDSARKHHAALSDPHAGDDARRVRPRPLKTRILTILASRPLSTPELVQALREDGYPSPTTGSAISTFYGLRSDGLIVGVRDPSRSTQIWSLP